MLRSPYRCRVCGERFSVTSRNVYYLAAALGVVILVLAIALVMLGDMDSDRSAHKPAIPASEHFESTIKRAESGDPAAEHQLAQMHAAGDGVPQDEKEAVAWLERAAEHGNAAAQYEFGIALREGRGTVQDDERAFEWLRRAAEAGNAHAQFELGRMCFIGVGTPVDKVRAYTWLNVAAAQGAVEAGRWRDVVRGQLSRDEIAQAQAEARRLSEFQSKQTAREP